jgi:molybdopterin synthase sulfur carrier subunit
VIRVQLPTPLRKLAGTEKEIQVEVAGPPTVAAVLDALEARYPVLAGTIRDHSSGVRRPFIRFFACEEDLSHTSADTLLPEAVASGWEPLVVVGAMAGG